MIEEELKQNQAFKNLCKSIADLRYVKEVEKFLRDIATFKELKDMSERLEAARLVNEGVSYRKINKQIE